MLESITATVKRWSTPLKGRLGASAMTYTMLIGLVSVMSLLAVEEAGDTVADDLLGEVGETMADAAGNLPIAFSMFETGLEDEPFNFSSATFSANFSETLESVRLTSLPQFGTLAVDGQPVTSGQSLSMADLDQLVLTPNQDFDGQIVFNWQGTADGTLWSRATFANIFFDPVEDEPGFQSIPDQTMVENSTLIVPIDLTGDGDPNPLVVTATSDTQSVLPNGGLALGGSGAAREITLTPATNQTGSAVVTLGFSDPALLATTTFRVTVTPADKVTDVSFTDLTGVEPGQSYFSETIALPNDFDGPIDVSISGNGAQFEIESNGLATSGQVSPGDRLYLTMAGPSSLGSTVSTSITLGDGTPVVWSVSTRDADTSPTLAGNFGRRDDVQPGSSQSSDPITVTEFDGPLAVSASNGAVVEAQIGGSGGFVPVSQINPGDVIRLVMTAPAEDEETGFATATIGSIVTQPFEVNTWAYTTANVLTWGACQAACGASGTQSPASWNCDRSDGTQGHDQAFCPPPNVTQNCVNTGPCDCAPGSSDGYSWSSLLHSASQTVTRPATVSNGAGEHEASASCDDGVVSVGNETLNVTACDTDYYNVGTSCVDVGTGYYSPDGDTTRNACSNGPANSSYTSAGGGINNCGWSCDSGFEEQSGSCNSTGCASGSQSGYSYSTFLTGQTQSVTKSGAPVSNGSGYYEATARCDGNDTVAIINESVVVNNCNTDYYRVGSNCSHVGNGYYSPNNSVSRFSCTGNPSNSSWTGSGGGGNNCSWGCNSGYSQSGGSCVSGCSSGSTSGYSYSSFSYGQTQGVSKSVSISNGGGHYSATARCDGNNSVAIYNQSLNVNRCNTDYYRTGSSCSHVGNGYYSPHNSVSRFSCTNKPGNSSYTGSGGGGNNCSWSCNSGYVQSGGSCQQQQYYLSWRVVTNYGGVFGSYVACNVVQTSPVCGHGVYCNCTGVGMHNYCGGYTNGQRTIQCSPGAPAEEIQCIVTTSPQAC